MQRHETVSGLKRLPHLLHVVERLLNGDLEVAEVDRLGDEVEGAAIHGGADVLHVIIGRNDDCADVRIDLRNLFQKR